MRVSKDGAAICPMALSGFRGYLVAMEVRKKLAILADAAKYDASCASSGVKRSAVKDGLGNASGMGICHSYAPDGRCISLLKILLTNYCTYDCSYCINRVSSDVRRAKFAIDEVVQLTLDFYRRNYIEGLFLSSGVFKDANHTMEEMIEVARRLRQVHKFGGYIHLKAVAGCSPELMEKAGLVADRLSANIELPTGGDMRLLAPAKTHAEAETAMQRIDSKIVELKSERRTIKSAPRFTPGGQSTQMIVGATPSSDTDILSKSTHLYHAYQLRRVYYSAFSPIPFSDPNLPSKSPPLVREHRLYQADWLMRFYGFQAQELTTAQEPNLDLQIDPKLAWALRHRDIFPIDVNRAAKHLLLRVPGFGVRTVERILQTRRYRHLRLVDLGKMHIPMQRTRWFIITQDSNPALRQLDTKRLESIVRPKPSQLSLFDTGAMARGGEI